MTEKLAEQSPYLREFHDATLKTDQKAHLAAKISLLDHDINHELTDDGVSNENETTDSEIEFEINEELIEFYAESLKYKKEKSKGSI